MSKFEGNNPLPFVSLTQAITDVIESIALMEASIANILDVEAKMVRRAEESEYGNEELVALNKSVDDIAKRMEKLQTLLQFELSTAEDLIKAIEYCEEE